MLREWGRFQRIEAADGRVAPRIADWLHRVRQSLLRGLLIPCIGLLCAVPHPARAASYVYDVQGRLVAITDATGATAQYTYDAMGNLLGISRIPAGQLAIFTLSPDHGAVGAPVTIAGQGFDATASGDAVSFNGTAATVSAATSTALTVSVPAGATTGTVTVTVGTATVNSPEPFTVDASGPAPTITGFSPQIVTAGDSVTVTGTNLLPVAGDTSVSVGTQVAQPTNLTNQQIAFPINASMGSGPITVETPYGVAQSSASLTVTPSGIPPSEIADEKNISPGQTQTLSIGATNQYGLLQLQAIRGDALSLQMDAISPSTATATYTVYGPTGYLVASGTVSASSPSIHLPVTLNYDGTYSIYFQPSGTAPLSLTIRMENDQSAWIDTSQTAISESEVTANESRRIVFNVANGDGPAYANISQVSPGETIAVLLQSAAGVSLQESSNSITQNGVIAFPALPQGAYIFTLTPSSDETLAASVQILLDDTSLSPDGPSANISTTVSGEQVVRAFSANAGENLEFALSGMMATNASGAVDVFIYDSSMKYIGYQSCHQSEGNGSCVVQLSGLPGGVYVAILQPGDNGVTGTFSATVTLTQDIAQAMSVNTPLNITMARPGAAVRATFEGTAGQPLDLAMTNITANQTLDITIYNPDGSTLAIDQVWAPSLFNKLSLPQTGQYTIYAQYQYGQTGGATLELLPSVSGALTVGGSSAAYQTTEQGQDIILSFDASAGQNVELALSSITSTSGTLNAAVYDKNGNYVNGSDCYQNSNFDNSCVLSLWNLAGGTYTVVLSPYQETDTISATVTLTEDTAVSLPLGQPTGVPLNAPGQLERLQFSATAGEPLDILVSGVTTNPSGFPVGVTLDNPNGTQQDGDYYTISAQGALHEYSLSQTGTYTLLVQNEYGVPGSSTIEAVTPETSVLTVDGATLDEQTSIAGEGEYLTFAASAGQNLEFALSNVLESESNPGITINLYGSSGNYINGIDCPFNAAGNPCMLSMWDLAAGNYLLAVLPSGFSASGASGGSGFGTETFGATLTQDLTGTIVSGQDVNIDLSQPGNLERLTYAGSAGGSPTVTITDPMTTPTGQRIEVDVYDPTGAYVTGGYFSSSGSLSLGALSTTGDYQIVVFGVNGVPATVQIGLQ